ncbi:hypothetical protein EUTSA_v10020821mg [Eutrema salsugineum]|uniref:RING-type E3 ubiquitin transferase n=1 Tax=Eutrema salsugineum TaxID=72664 RepID=V4MBM6_EUTSA|nr:E3 ubiquitin-protein ligase Praja-2 [Eutrema salsugineum]ESQ49878.1 hypothetical protein EUTSA_v10020821mg [Eutrema salsugineum]
MASTKPGPEIDLEEEAEGGGAAVDCLNFTADGEATSLLVCYSALDDRDIDCNPYFPFSGAISDSGSGSYTDTEPAPYNCPIDFFDRESSGVDAAEYLESEGLTTDDFNIWGFYDPKEDEEEIVLGAGCVSGSGSGSDSDRQHGNSDEQGLRVTGIDSDSDYEDGVFDFTLGDSENEANVLGRVEVGTGRPPVWDYAFDGETMVADEDLEELQNAISWTLMSFSRSEEEEEEGEEELSSPSRNSSRDDQEEHELDWQVLLTVNNVVNYIEQAEGIVISPGDIDPSHYLYLASLDEYAENHIDDDAIFGQMFDNETGIRGNPPAAKRVIEDLPVVELTVEEVNKGNIFCAVCKDEMVIEEKVNMLPCRHSYHGECIVSWLKIRNTCPVCRFEFPTDDFEYERHRRSSQSSLFLTG